MCLAAKYSILAAAEKSNAYVELDKDVHSYAAKVVLISAESAELALCLYHEFLENNNGTLSLSCSGNTVCANLPSVVHFLM